MPIDNKDRMDSMEAFDLIEFRIKEALNLFYKDEYEYDDWEDPDTLIAALSDIRDIVREARR